MGKANEGFPARLRRAREGRGLSQADLAERAGFQPSAISHFDTGRRAPSFDNLRRLADALGVSTDFLLGRVDEPTGSGPIAQQLFRDLGAMSQSDQESLAAMASVLAKKNRLEGQQLKRAEAVRYAERLVEQLGIQSLPVDPFAIAAEYDIEVRPKVSDEPGVSGFLMKVGDSIGIMFATHIDNEGHKRFTVSHELGHYFLPGHPEHLFSGERTVHASHSGFISNDPYELQADHFASSLLMPSALFVPAIRGAGHGFDAIETLSKQCETSLTATAIRLATHTEDAVAVVMSRADRIEYCFMSECLRALRGLEWLRKGTVLPRQSETFAFNRERDNIDQCKRSQAWTNLDLWFDGAPDVEMKEDVVGLGSYGKTLTVLFTDEALPSEEDGDE